MDYTLKASIKWLRKISIYLFLFTNVALFGTLFAQNLLTTSNFNYNYIIVSGDASEQYKCNKDNNFCFNVWTHFNIFISKLEPHVISSAIVGTPF